MLTTHLPRRHLLVRARTLGLAWGLLSLLLSSFAAGQEQKPVSASYQEFASPSLKTIVRISAWQPHGALTLSLRRNGQVWFDEQLIDFELENGLRPALFAGASSELSSGNLQHFTLPWGKCREVEVTSRESVLQMTTPQGEAWVLRLRVADDAVSWRYELNAAKLKVPSITLKEENIQFAAVGNPQAMALPLPNYVTSHEGVYLHRPLEELPSGQLFDTPLLLHWPDGRAAAIAEGALAHTGGMYLELTDAEAAPRHEDSREAPQATTATQAQRRKVLRTRLAPLPETASPTDPAATTGVSDPNVAVNANTLAAPSTTAPTRPLSLPAQDYVSSWRTILLADRAGELLTSNWLLSLNPPPEGDFSWAKPGKTSWNWWHGIPSEQFPFAYGPNLETEKYYIDFCARNKILYHSVISAKRTWYEQSGDGYMPVADTDILTPRPELEWPKLAAYAKEKGVKLRVWVHWQPLFEKYEQAFPLYEKLGISGMMIDFMDRNDQEMVEWQHKVLALAAKHHLHIHFHGSYPPSGEQRTFPNLFNREAALNLEYLKWGKEADPAHTVRVAYTRNLAGPTDYHLGGMRSVLPEAFSPRNDDPLVMGTRCHHLGLYVVFENPLPMLSDTPSAYEQAEGLEFLQEVPSTWDQTWFVAGEPGEYLVLARKSGDRVYLGGINNLTERTITLPLTEIWRRAQTAPQKVGSFGSPVQPTRIPAAKWKLWTDAFSGQQVLPAATEKLEQTESATGTLSVRLGSGGGLAGWLEPAK